MTSPPSTCQHKSLSAQELLSMTCATCGHHSTRLTDLRNHKRNLACNLPLRNCDVCGRKFSHSSRLREHKRKAVCTIDSAGILSANELSSKKCDKCLYVTPQLSELRRHKRRALCNRYSKKKEILPATENIHDPTVLPSLISSAKELPFMECDKCGHIFTR